MILQLALYLTFTVGGLILIKLGSVGLKFGFSLSMFNFQLPGIFLLGILCYGISFLLWIWIVSTNTLSIVYPIALGISYIAIMILSFIVLKEPISMMNIIGIVFVLIGVILISIKL